MQAVNGTKTMGKVYLVIHLIALIRKIKSNPKEYKIHHLVQKMHLLNSLLVFLNRSYFFQVLSF